MASTGNVMNDKVILTLRPSALQFVVDELPLLLLCAAGLGYTLLCYPFWKIVLLFVAALLVFLSYRLHYLLNMKYTFTTEELRNESGLFSRRKGHMELYRIYDFEEKRSFMQILFGLKTVIIEGGDKTDPQLPIIGIKNSLDLCGLLRPYVEKQRKEHKITEIANR